MALAITCFALLDKSGLRQAGASGNASAFKIEGDNFVQLDGWHVNHEGAAVMPNGDLFPGDKEMSTRDAAPVCRGTEPDNLLSHGNDFADGPFEHHRVGEVHEMSGEGVLLAPEGYLEHAFPLRTSNHPV